MDLLKEMSLANGKSYLLTLDEAKTVVAAMMSGEKGSVGIERLGMAVNIASVMSVADPETVPYFWGNKMDKSLTKIFRDGEWISFSGYGKEEYMNQIEYRLKNDISVVVEQDKNKLIQNHETKISEEQGKSFRELPHRNFKRATGW